MTTHRPTPMDRAPSDPTAPLLGPDQWHVNAPSFGRGEVPAHVALIMDGNGRWANSRGLTRTEGHRAGEYALMDTIAGAIDAGVRYLSVYTFSTENWKRSPAEVSFIMNYASDVLARRTDQLAQWGVHVQLRWARRAGRRRAIHRRGRGCGTPESARRQRKNLRAPPVPARRPRCGPHDPHVGGAAPVQLSAVADGLRGDDVRRYSLARIRSRGAVGLPGGVRGT